MAAKTWDDIYGEGAQQARSLQTTLTALELEKLGDMTADDLIALVERMARQCGMVAAMSKEETAQAMLDVLAHTALRPVLATSNIKADIQSRMTAIDKWLDRTTGKVAQKNDVDGSGGIVIQIVQMNRSERDYELGKIIENKATHTLYAKEEIGIKNGEINGEAQG